MSSEFVLTRLRYGTVLEDSFPSLDKAIEQACIEIRYFDEDSGVSYAAGYSISQGQTLMIDHLTIVARCYGDGE